MPNPGKARGAKSRANLKRGGSPGRPKTSPEMAEVRRISRKLLLDPRYQKMLADRLNTGRIQPGVEVVVWYYAWGKPIETIETKQVVPVRIQHEYTT